MLCVCVCVCHKNLRCYIACCTLEISPCDGRRAKFGQRARLLYSTLLALFSNFFFSNFITIHYLRSHTPISSFGNSGICRLLKMATYYTYGQDNPSQVAADAPKDGPTVYEYRPPQNPGGAPAGQPYSYCDVRYIWSDQPLKMPECYPVRCFVWSFSCLPSSLFWILHSNSFDPSNC